MHSSPQLLDLLAKAKGLRSDYQIAKYLGISRQRISLYRLKHQSLPYALGIKIADVTHLDRGYVMACLAFERAEDGNEKAAWMEAARRLDNMCIMLTRDRQKQPRRRWYDVRPLPPLPA